MSSTTETRTVVEQIVDNADERELWIVGKEHERPPYFHAGKGGDMRLARALRVCVENRIMPNGDGSYMVEGSEHRTYRVGDSCSCPNSQKAHTKWCYHMVAVAVYVEWQRRLRPPAPVELGTMRAGTLPLPPVTVDERLAQATPPADPFVLNLPEEGLVRVDVSGHAVALGTLPLPPVTVDERLAQSATAARDRVFDALPVHQEDRMADHEYLPEPDTDEPPVAVLDAPERKEEKKESPRPLPGPVLLPALDARTLEQSMQAWADQRAVVKRFIQTQLVDGTDYYTLQMGQRASKPTLSKAGSEKFLGLFQLHATFTQDTATWTMLGEPKGTLCYVCHLLTRSGEVVSEGRGARDVLKEKDINKAIKMAQKSAQIDAVLRTGALSEAFTQDINDADDQPVPEDTPAKATSADLRKRIWELVKTLAPNVQSREDAEEFVRHTTGMILHPDNYPAILAKLREEVR